MGDRNLKGFREKLKIILGNAGHSETQLNQWINDGYKDLGTAVDLKPLWCTVTVKTAKGDNSYGVPNDLVAVRMLKIDGEGRLTRTGPEEFFLQDVSSEGLPEQWSTDDRTIRLMPTPDKVYTLRLLYNREPATLVQDTDTTILSAGWDRAVELLAANHALTDLEEHNKANDYLRRASSYISSRLHMDEIETEGPNTRGVNVARKASDMRTLRG